MVVGLLCAVMVLLLAACGGKTTENNEPNASASSESTEIKQENVQIPNPWTECDSIEEAAENAGFAFETPKEIGDYKITSVCNLDQTMIEVVYQLTDDEEKEITIRKGSGTDDISGDYTSYSESKQVKIGEYDVTEQGDEGSVNLATWTADGYSYSVSVPEMAEEDIVSIIQQVK